MRCVHSPRMLHATLLVFALLMTGCGENPTNVAKVQARNGEAAASDTAVEHGKVPEFKGKISKKYEDSVEWWAPKMRPPADAPNVIIFLLDDTGFGQIGSFGGLINTPNIDKLAEGGSVRSSRTRRDGGWCWSSLRGRWGRMYRPC